MERLTTKTKDGYERQSIRTKNQQLIDKLADYENLEEHGRLLKLPCKVGDTVYEICGATVRGYDWKVLTYETAYVRKTIFNLSRFYDFGETVFLTKSEAEAKLKELRGKENGQ